MKSVLRLHKPSAHAGGAPRRLRASCAAHAAPSGERASAAMPQLPDVDWSRYHLQVSAFHTDGMLVMC
jgi:hypothetical protein